VEAAVPWRTPDLVKIREEFVEQAMSGRHPVAALCNAYGISEKTGHKWLNRFKEEGRPGLSDRSRAPHESPQRISLEVRREILALREKHPTWGPRKLCVVLRRRVPGKHWPAASSIGELLRREGCVRPRRRRNSGTGLPIDAGLTVASAPNDVWSTDFKGQFRLTNGELCYPLTAQDTFSRFVIGTTALSSTASLPVEIAFARHFEEYGLPKVIRSDNGVPFASPSAIGRLSKLSVWWIRLGIRPERIEPGEPQQNGTHERMHKTLKADATRPPGSSLSEQQLRFDRFRREYNDERPHESLGQETPASCYSPSARAFPSCLPELNYPGHFEVRVVTQSGAINFGGRRFQISTALTNQELGLEETDDDLWTVNFGPLVLGTLHYPSSTFIEEVSWKTPDTPPEEERKAPVPMPTTTKDLPMSPV
jgi:transposase InsO family protein